MNAPGISRPESAVPLQERIELVMNSFHREDRWESIYLFSCEGLLLAGCGRSEDEKQDSLLEYAFSLIETSRLMEEKSVREINIQIHGRRYMIFRYFTAWDESLILAAVVSGKKGYKRAIGRLIRHIQEVK